MKTLYIDCGMGAAGDMLTAALIELTEDKKAFANKLNGIGIPAVHYHLDEENKSGITGNHIHVHVHGIEEGCEHHEHEHHHEHHHHSSMADIEHIIDHLKVSDKVKADAKAVYNIIAQAESEVHGRPVTEIHFHEVGTYDAIADVVAVCLLIEEIAPNKIVASPVHVGSGEVKCAHGILPVPAPATALILKGIPIYSAGIRGELCTPTGAALLKYFVNEFGDMPVLSIDKIGYGFGTKEFERLNAVRVLLGDTNDCTDSIIELNCNIDDMSGEEIGFATECILKEGARDVFTTAINMKKNRPGIKLTVICDEQSKDSVVKAIFKHTSTLGIRESIQSRYVLSREMGVKATEYGDIRYKHSYGYGVDRFKYEYDDLSEIATKQGISINKLKEML